MSKLSIEFPTNEEFLNMNKVQAKEILEEYKKIKQEGDRFIENYIEASIADILIEHPGINSLVLDPKYEYNDEGYAPSFIMPFINGEYYGDDSSGIDDDVFEKIDYACAEISHLLTEDISVDVDLVRKKYSAKKLNEELPKKENNNKKRYKP